MRAEYTTEVCCRCPVDKKTDFYTLTVRSPRTIPVETILDAVESLKEQVMFQEDVTVALHRILGGEVETVGTHSGVYTRVVVGKES